MTDEDMPTQKKFSLDKIPHFIFAYAALLAFVYEYSFWNKFSINILEYASFSDISRMAVFPMIGASLISMLYPSDMKSWR